MPNRSFRRGSVPQHPSLDEDELGPSRHSLASLSLSCIKGKSVSLLDRVRATATLCSLSNPVVQGELSASWEFETSAIELLLQASASVFCDSSFFEEGISSPNSSDQTGSSRIDLTSDESKTTTSTSDGEDELRGTVLDSSFQLNEEDFWADSEARSNTPTTPTPTLTPRRFPFNSKGFPLSPTSITYATTSSSGTRSIRTLSEPLNPPFQTHSFHPNHPRVRNRYLRVRKKALKGREGGEREDHYHPPRPCSCLVDYEDETTTSSDEEVLERTREGGEKGKVVVRRRSLFLSGATVRGRGII